MSDERIVELDLGVSPEAGVSGAMLLQSETSVVLFFNYSSLGPWRNWQTQGT